jgi:hypothetical protein
MPFYLFVLVGLLIFFTAPFIDISLKSIGIRSSLFRYIAYFNLMNVALLYGLVKYLNGTTSSVWNPTKRNV